LNGDNPTTIARKTYLPLKQVHSVQSIA